MAAEYSARTKAVCPESHGLSLKPKTWAIIRTLSGIAFGHSIRPRVGTASAGSMEGMDMAFAHQAAKLAAFLTTACTAGIVLAQPVAAAWPGNNGKIVFWKADVTSHAANGQIYSMNSQGGKQLNLSAAGGGAGQIDIQPSVSPDGKLIVFLRGVIPDPNNPVIIGQLFTMRIDGSHQTDITNDLSFTASGPAWTEDGSHFLFVKQPAGQFPGFGGSLWIQSADGKGTPRQLTQGTTDANPAMSPDGDLLAFSRVDFSDPLPNPAQGFWRHLMLMKADGDEPAVDLGRGSKPDWSPDSKRIVYGQAGTGPIMVVSVPDAKRKKQLADFGNEAPAWSPDGRKIVYVDCTSRSMPCQIAVMSADGRNQHDITNESGFSLMKPDWQRVGRGRGEGGD